MRVFGANAVELVNGVPRISFQQFLTLIGHFPNDRHWMRYTDLCQPCHIQYDSVLKLETLERDLEQTMPLFLNPSQQAANLTHGNRQRYQANKLSSVTEALQKVDPHLVRQTLDFYGHDMTLFGYTWDSLTGAGCHYGNHSTCC